jgi:hypothetical protein
MINQVIRYRHDAANSRFLTVGVDEEALDPVSDAVQRPG